MSVRLIGARRFGSCGRHTAVSNAFTNGIGWRELCDRCADAPFALLAATSAPVRPLLTAAAR